MVLIIFEELSYESPFDIVVSWESAPEESIVQSSVAILPLVAIVNGLTYVELLNYF